MHKYEFVEVEKITVTPEGKVTFTGRPVLPGKCRKWLVRCGKLLQRRCDYCRMVENDAATIANRHGFPMNYCPVCKRKLCYKRR